MDSPGHAFGWRATHDTWKTPPFSFTTIDFSIKPPQYNILVVSHIVYSCFSYLTHTGYNFSTAIYSPSLLFKSLYPSTVLIFYISALEPQILGFLNLHHMRVEATPR